MSRTSTEPAGTGRHVLSGPTMGTRWTAVLPHLSGPDAPRVAAALSDAVREVDDEMSTWKPSSDLMRLNGAPLRQWVPLPGGLMYVLAASLAFGRLTDGAFDIGVGAAVARWGFGAQAGQDQDSAAAGRLAIDLLELDEAAGRARKHAPAALDLSGIAKGWGVDRMAATLDALGIADYLVGIDGELRSRGRRADGEPFTVALERPEPGRREPFGALALEEAAVATSGDYRHRHEVRGRAVSHTIDPRTGAPVDHALASATVVAGDAMTADAIATALMVAGPDRGPVLAERLGASAILVVRGVDGLQVVETGRFAQQ